MTEAKDSDDKLKRFMLMVNSTYKSKLIEVGGRFRALNMPRFSSGILSVDLALGGGWPFSRVAMIAGEESTGKTYLTLKAASEVENYDHITKKHKRFCEEGKFIPGRALFVDVEGSFDAGWARANGFNEDWHVVARPEYSEQVIDIITAAIMEGIFDLIILDSIAAMTPATEIEETAEKWQMGLAARLNNKAFRRWNASLVKMSNTGVPGPLLLCLNQIRYKIGSDAMFGDPRVLPGGQMQKFASAIVIYTKAQKYSDKDEAEMKSVSLSGVARKNKTYIPRQNYKFELTLKDMGGAESRGYVDNAKQLMDAGKKYRLIVTKGGVTRFGKKEFSNQKELRAQLEVSPSLRATMWRSVIKAATGALI